jgi:hypothetical protein
MDPWQAQDRFSEKDGVLTLEATLWLLALLDYIAALEARIEALETP